MESNNLNFSSLVDLARKYIKIYIIVGLVALAAGAIITMPSIMKPKFTSVAVVYPLNLRPYSDESETEQLLQYFESSSVRDSIINKFDLYSRYNIWTDMESARYYMLAEFSDRFVVSKTLYESVRVEVTDENPEMAKRMADEFLNQVNNKINASINKQGALMATSFKQQMDYQRSVMDSLEAAISRLSTENRLLDYESQTRELIKGYIELSGKSSSSPALKEVREWLDNTQQSGSILRMLQNLSYFATIQHDQLARDYFKFREFEYRDVSYLDVVIEPEISDKKSWPVRWVVLAISVGAALLLLTVILAVATALKK